MTPLNLALEPATGAAVPAERDLHFPHGEPQARVLYVHPNDARALVEPTRDGNDYTRVCARHQWAAPAVTRFIDLDECPECVAERDACDGRRRYELLHAANVRIVGTV